MAISIVTNSCLNTTSSAQLVPPSYPLITKIFWASVAPFDFFVGVLLTQPLADALALKTYTHGTNFPNYLNIRCYGADPTKGGAQNGSSASVNKSYVKRSKNYFHLFKDLNEIERNKLYFTIDEKVVNFEHGELVSLVIDDKKIQKYQGINGVLVQNDKPISIPDYFYSINKIGRKSVKISSLFCTMIEGDYIEFWERLSLRQIHPMGHALQSGANSWSSSNYSNLFILLFGGICGLATPIVSIRTATGDPLERELEIDPDYYNFAYRTKAQISPRYIGLEGIVRQGLSGNIWQRVKAEPIKVAIGTIRLALLITALWILINKSVWKGPEIRFVSEY